MKRMLQLLVLLGYIIWIAQSLDAVILPNPRGIGGIFKGPNLETLIKGPDSSVITTAQHGGTAQTHTKSKPIIAAELQEVPISNIDDSFDFHLTTVATAPLIETIELVPQELHNIETEIEMSNSDPQETSNWAGPSGSITISGSTTLSGSEPAAILSASLSTPTRLDVNYIQTPLISANYGLSWPTNSGNIYINDRVKLQPHFPSSAHLGDIGIGFDSYKILPSTVPPPYLWTPEQSVLSQPSVQVTTPVPPPPLQPNRMALSKSSPQNSVISTLPAPASLSSKIDKLLLLNSLEPQIITGNDQENRENINSSFSPIGKYYLNIPPRTWDSSENLEAGLQSSIPYLSGLGTNLGPTLERGTIASNSGTHLPYSAHIHGNTPSISDELGSYQDTTQRSVPIVSNSGTYTPNGQYAPHSPIILQGTKPELLLPTENSLRRLRAMKQEISPKGINDNIALSVSPTTAAVKSQEVNLQQLLNEAITNNRQLTIDLSKIPLRNIVPPEIRPLPPLPRETVDLAITSSILSDPTSIPTATSRIPKIQRASISNIQRIENQEVTINGRLGNFENLLVTPLRDLGLTTGSNSGVDGKIGLNVEPSTLPKIQIKENINAEVDAEQIDGRLDILDVNGHNQVQGSSFGHLAVNLPLLRDTNPISIQGTIQNQLAIQGVDPSQINFTNVPLLSISHVW